MSNADYLGRHLPPDRPHRRRPDHYLHLRPLRLPHRPADRHRRAPLPELSHGLRGSVHRGRSGWRSRNALRTRLCRSSRWSDQQCHPPRPLGERVQRASSRLRRGHWGPGWAGRRKVLPGLAKNYLSNQFKGAIGEGLSELGLQASGQTILRSLARNGNSSSTFDALLADGRCVEAIFRSSQLSVAKRHSLPNVDVDVYYLTYDTVSGLTAAGPAAAAPHWKP